MTAPARKVLFILLGTLLLGGRYAYVHSVFQRDRAALLPVSHGLHRVLVLGEPQVLFTRDMEGREPLRVGGRYSPGVREVRVDGALLSIDGRRVPSVRVRCTLRLSKGIPAQVLSYGDEIAFWGRLQVPRRALNPGQFDHERYLRRKGIAFTAYPKPEGWWKAPVLPGGASFPRFCFDLKRWAGEALRRHMPYPESALLEGILLGERSGLPREMVEDFLLTGTVHILAVSGLMTAFVSGLLFFCLRSLGFPRKWAAGASLLGLACFVCMTGAEAPVCRAGLFSGLALAGVLMERKVRGGTLLLATAFVLALEDPFSPLDLSFQISFLATAGLMAGAPLLEAKVSALGRPLAGLLSTTVAAQVSVAGLLVFHFNQASPYSLPANLAVVPLAFLATAVGLAALLGAALHPFLGDLLGSACAVCLKVLMACAQGMAGLPGGAGLLPSPPAPFVLIFHLLLGATFWAVWPREFPEAPSAAWRKGWDLLSLARRRLLWSWGLFTGLCLAFLVLGPLLGPKWRVTYLAVGHGNAAVLEAPDGRVLVVDVGRRTSGPDRYHPLVAYLRHRGIREVEGVLISHPDADHGGGLANLAGACRIGTLFLPSYPGEGTLPDAGMEELRAKGTRIAFLEKGDRFPVGGDLWGRTLHPGPGFRPRRSRDNNLSLVVGLEIFGRSFLFPGDLEKEGLRHLFLQGTWARPVDWLLAPHHGRGSGEPELSASGFAPRHLVISDLRDHPKATRIYREKAPGVLTFSTAREGAMEVEVFSDGSGRYRSFLGGKGGIFSALPPRGGGGQVDLSEKQGL
jgi:competence protein ComEC